MTTQGDLLGALRDGIPFVGVMVFWLVVTLIVYGGFTVVWPDVPEAEPWIYLGIYIIPVIGYLGHTAQQARKLSQP